MRFLRRIPREIRPGKRKIMLFVLLLKAKGIPQTSNLTF
jgi:hypothetical protein